MDSDQVDDGFPEPGGGVDGFGVKGLEVLAPAGADVAFHLAAVALADDVGETRKVPVRLFLKG